MKSPAFLPTPPAAPPFRHQKSPSQIVCTQSPRAPRPPRTRRSRPRAPPSDPREDRWAPENLGFLHVATITGAHGVRGEAKAREEGDFAAHRLGGARCSHYLLLPGRRYPRPVALAPGRRASQAGGWILRIRGVDTREAVDALRGARVYVRDSDRPRLARGEFMVGDLVRTRVGLVEGSGRIGVVESVVTRDELCRAAGSGKAGAAVAADLIEVALFDVSDGVGRFEGDVPDDAKRVLVPFVKQIVPVVDMEQGLVLLDPPPGLLEIAVVNRKKKPRRPRALLMPVKD